MNDLNQKMQQKEQCLKSILAEISSLKIRLDQLEMRNVELEVVSQDQLSKKTRQLEHQLVRK
jgi:hypothetical protein